MGTPSALPVMLLQCFPELCDEYPSMHAFRLCPNSAEARSLRYQGWRNFINSCSVLLFELTRNMFFISKPSRGRSRVHTRFRDPFFFALSWFFKVLHGDMALCRPPQCVPRSMQYGTEAASHQIPISAETVRINFIHQ